MKISKNPDVNWKNDEIQFPRLIMELESCGAFADCYFMEKLCDSMDLTEKEICEIIDRAQKKWDKIISIAKSH